MNIFQQRTIEEEARTNFEVFRTDAAFTVVTAMASITESLAIRARDIVALSAKTEWRAEYGILRDYSKDKDTLSAADRLMKLIHKYDSYAGLICKSLSIQSCTYGGSFKGRDGGEDMLARIDNCDEKFKDDFENLRKVLNSKLKPYKCSDPQALYPIVYALVMALRFPVFVDSFQWDILSFRKGESLYPLTRLNLYVPLADLLKRCKFFDKNGNPMVFLLTYTDKEQWAKNLQKKSWQVKNKDINYVVVDLYDILATDEVLRAVYRIEHRLTDLKNIDEVIANAQEVDPEYRNDYAFTHFVHCTSTFEQMMLNACIKTHNWHDLPNRLKQFLDTVDIDKAVAMFHLTPVRDKQGNVKTELYKGKRIEQTKSKFIGIWNTMEDASAEWFVPVEEIKESACSKRGTDKNGNTWLTMSDYISVAYNEMKACYPEYAEEMLTLIPQLKTA